MLRDRLVCGPQIQKRLLAEERLTFKKALDTSLALEAANKGTKQLQAAASATPSNQVLVHKVQEGERSSPSIKCYRCGKPNHKAPECCYRDSICAKCKKGALSKSVSQHKEHTPTVKI